MKYKWVPAVALAGLLCAAITPTALAGQAQWTTTKSCSQGSVFTRAHANYTVTHGVKAGTWKEKVFPSNSSLMRTTTFYSGQPVTTAAKIFNLGDMRNAVYKWAY